MKEKDSITVYWSPSAYRPENESWSLLYSKPENLFNEHRKNKNKEGTTQNIFSCPGMTGMFDNIYVVKHQFDNIFTLPENIEEIPKGDWIDTASSVGVFSPRKSSLDNYYNLHYNMGWLLFADEPLIARFTAPFFPPFAPAEGAMLSSGEFDIGSWYRPFNLDYHIPVSKKTLSFKKDDPLFYVEFKTDKKIIFKRYNLSSKLNNLGVEMSNSPARYSRFLSLKERYGIAKKAMIPELVLSEIKKNLVD
jgi:hypothetical protein